MAHLSAVRAPRSQQREPIATTSLSSPSQTHADVLPFGRSGRAEARRRLVEQHLGLADGIARQYANRGLELDDLVQVARLGLVLAAERYRAGAGESFAAYAAPTVRGELRRHFRDHGWVVRPPRRVQELRARARAACRTLEQEQGHTPTRAELADALDVQEQELAECAAADTSFSPLSLEAPSAATDAPLSEQLGAESAELEGMADLLTLRRELRCLTAREQRVIQWRFADGLTQSEIAERLGVSQMQVSRILSSIVARLREAFDPEPLVS